MFDIDSVQRAMCETGALELKTEQVPLYQAVGRVLAETLRPPTAGPTLKAGTRLQSKHVPQLATMGLTALRVFRKIRVGVLTLAGPVDGAQATGARGIGIGAGPGTAGPMISALLDGLGAVAIAAPRVSGDAGKVDAVLDMLLNECDLVLVAGCVTEARHRELQRTLSARRASLSEQLLCAELGARLTVGQLAGKVVVCLPSGPAESFMAFMLLISPMIRHLQGRIDPMPESHRVTVRRGAPARPSGCGFAWARETAVRAELLVRPHAPSDPVDAIAWADGIARCPTSSALDEPATAEYYPFSSWLQ